MQFDAEKNPIYCSGHGSCDTKPGVCACNVGWGGASNACDETVWVDLGLAAGNVDQSSENAFYKKPRYRWFAEEKVCKFEGTVVNTNSGLEYVAVVDSRHECFPKFPGHMIFEGPGGNGHYGNEKTQRVDLYNDGRIIWSAKKAWVSLDMMLYNPYSSSKVYSVSQWFSGWQNYNNGWENVGYSLVADNTICMVTGLIYHHAGHGETAILRLPPECRPRGRLIFQTMAYNEAVGYDNVRIDVLPDGLVYLIAWPMRGTGYAWYSRAAWLSLTGIVFAKAAATGTLSVTPYGYEYLTPSYFSTKNLCVFNGLMRTNADTGSGTFTIVDLSKLPCKPSGNHIVDVSQHEQRLRVDANGGAIYLSPGISRYFEWIPFDGIVLTKS